MPRFFFATVLSVLGEGRNKSSAQRTFSKQIAQLVQLNEGQPYTYDRDALVKLLDEALAGSRPRTP